MGSVAQEAKVLLQDSRRVCQLHTLLSTRHLSKKKKVIVDPQPEMIVSTVNSVHFLSTVICYVDRETACFKPIWQMQLISSALNCLFLIVHTDTQAEGRRGRMRRQLMALLCQ